MSTATEVIIPLATGLAEAAQRRQRRADERERAENSETDRKRVTEIQAQREFKAFQSIKEVRNNSRLVLFSRASAGGSLIKW